VAAGRTRGSHQLKGESSRLLNTLEERLCRRGHRKDIIFEGFYGISAKRASSECRDCTGELCFEFSKKTGSPRIL
jgi:hypothetical protein